MPTDVLKTRARVVMYKNSTIAALRARCDRERADGVSDDRGRESVRSPSLRTGQAGLPHPALQLVVHLDEG